MRTVKLTRVGGDLIPVEAERVSPDVFAGLSLAEIKELEVWQGNRIMRIRDLFSVEGDEETAASEETKIVLEGDFSRVKRVGEGMSSGTIEARGDLGMHAGNNMRGGTLHIEGNAGDWLGREMRGGSIVVEGSAENYVGSGYRGERCGMRGGSIVVKGTAGIYLGEHMCGGEISVYGDAGDFPGAANNGGTIVIGGRAHLPGAEMTKGTITVRGTARILPSYQPLEEVEIDGVAYKKYAGDLVDNGKGELYVALSAGQAA